MLSILFVDDEPNILTGLQRMLRPMRHEWELYFAPSGEAALALLAEKKVDVIISDMQMPGMDGAELLQQVSDKYPHIVRIIFSGYSERAMVMRSIRVAHQYLTKPCDAELLIITVSQACALRYLLNDMNLRRLVSQMKVIPSLPSLYAELMSELKIREPSLKRISNIIRQDIGMTAKVLQIMNSAFFGLPRNISDVSEAVSLLGLETLSALVLSVGIFSQLQDVKQQSVIGQLWEHSMAVGRRAKAIAFSEAPETAADAFTAGLLHDIGQLVVAVNLPQQYLTIQEVVKKGQLTWAEAENLILGTHHSALGAYLLELWGLPSPIVEAVAFFHNPSGFETNSFTPLTGVHIANSLEHFTEDEILAHPEQYLDTAYLHKLGVLEKLPLWVKHSAVGKSVTV